MLYCRPKLQNRADTIHGVEDVDISRRAGALVAIKAGESKNSLPKPSHARPPYILVDSEMSIPVMLLTNVAIGHFRNLGLTRRQMQERSQSFAVGSCGFYTSP